MNLAPACPSPILRLSRLLHANGRHYGTLLTRRLDTWRIRHLAAIRYAHLRVPAWDDGRVQELAAADSPLARLLALDRQSVATAERILAGEFRLFGQTIHAEGSFPDWHRDYFSHHVYPVQPYPVYALAVDRGIDIVCPWELSRLHFVPTLVNAFRTTGDNRYREAYLAAAENWEQHNPYLFGVNWMCGLDIAIRALNLAVGLIFFDDPDDGRCGRIRRQIWAHIVYLQNRDLYARKRVVNNHHLIAAAIQFALLHLFSGAKAKRWRASAAEVVNSETARQFRQDGGNVESAFAYHQFVLEALAISALFASASGGHGFQSSAIFPDETAKDRIRRALSFVSSYMQAWGNMPQVGDSSDGRVMFHRQYFEWRASDPAYLMDLSAELYPNDDPFKYARRVAPEVFADSGVGTLVNSRYGVLVTAMPVEPTAGGHNHMDRTGVLLRIGKHPVLVDSGTYCYTSDITSRARFRSSRAHNVVIVSEAEQSAINEFAVFDTPSFGDGGLALELANAAAPEFVAFHGGYTRIEHCGTVIRRVICHEDRIEIWDAVSGTARTMLELVFNFHPDITVRIGGDGLLLTHSGEQLASLRVSPGWHPLRDVGAYSDSYRATRECVRITFKSLIKLPCEVCTSILIRGPLTCKWHSNRSYRPHDPRYALRARHQQRRAT